jgi:hypothetical protein
MNAALAGLIDEFVKLAGNYLSWDFVEKLRAQNAASVSEIEDAHNKRMDARDAMRDAGRQLARELVATGLDAKTVLLLLHCIDGGGGARKVRQLWPKTKVSLQQLALQLTEAEQVKGIDSDSDSKNAERDKIASDRKLAPSRLKAYGQFRWAIRQNAALEGASDREVYEWLEDHYNTEPLPKFASWDRYLREARAFHDVRKHTPRSGRNTGRSIVRSDQI